MIKIEVNNGPLDLFEDQDFYITRQVNDIFNLNNRNSDYTKTLKIPNSPGNRTKLEIQNDELKPPDRHRCSLFIQGQSFAINADLVINKIEKYYIETSLLIGASNFFSLVPNQSIKVLDLVEHNFTWDLTGVAAENTNTEGVIFGKSIFFDMVNCREETIIGGSPGTAFDVYADLWVYGFSFYIKTLLEKIVTNAGFSFDDSQVADIENYKDAVFMCPIYGLIDQDLEATILALVDMESPPQVVTGTTANVDFVANTDPGGLWNNTNDEYSIGSTESYTILLRYDITVTIDPLLTVSGVELRIKNGTTVLDTLKITASGDYSGSIQLKETLALGSTLYVEAFAASTVGANNVLQLNSECDFAISSNQPLFSRNLKVADHLPDVNQRTLISAFLSLSNTVMVLDDPSKSVVLKSFDSIFYKNPIDLTLNLDPEREIIKSYIPNNYYQSSRIAYANYSNLFRTDAIFEVNIDNVNLNLIGNIIDFPFEASDKERLYARDLSYSPAFRGSLSEETGLTGASGSANFALAAAVDFAPGDFIDVGIDTMRIATKTSATAGTIAGTWNVNHSAANWSLIKFQRGSIAARVGLVDQSTSTSLSTSDGDLSAGSTISCRDIYFKTELEPESIYDNYYKNLLDCINKFIGFSCWLRLDAITFKNLDLTRPIYLQNFASKFYINKLEQWKPPGLVRAELIRINKEAE
jgi:hypothetical protein